MKKLISIIMGSDSDLPTMKDTAKTLEEFEVGYEIKILSAHRTPDDLKEYIKQAEQTGIELFIAAAGGAAHLAGVIAAHTTLPVIGVPMESPLNGFDSILSMLQMPPGVPVAVVSKGSWGAKNSAILAIQILSLKYPELKEKLKQYKQKMAESVRQKNNALQI
ncbi:MAG: 5-(carboxyamino)imidazole ribonucleotide mutase [Endomicrobiia bacterium]